MEYNNPPHPFSISPHLHLPCMMQVQSVQQEISVIRQRAHLPAIIAWYLRHSLCLLVGTAGFIRRGVNDSNRNKNDLWPQCWWPLSRITPHLLFLILLVSVIKWNNNIIYYNRSNNTGSAVKARIEKQTTRRCGLSPQSLDLNIIRVVRECNTRQRTSREDLWDVVQEVWGTIPAENTRQRVHTVEK